MQTLADTTSRVGSPHDSPDDELQNVNLADYARTNERLDLQKRGKNAYKYTGYDDDDFSSGRPGQSRGVLSKYDSAIGVNQDKDEGFRIGASTAASTSAAGPSGVSSRSRGIVAQEEAERELKKDLLSLDYTSTFAFGVSSAHCSARR